MHPAVNVLNELTMLARIPRTGFAFLGSGQQSVAEHSYGTVMVAIVLADLIDEDVDRNRLLMLCLFHDALEARTGDLNYLNKRYLQRNDTTALEDLQRNCSPTLTRELSSLIDEFESAESLEAKLAHDADQLELLLVLKREYDTGNPRGLEWFDIVVTRLITPSAKQLAQQIRETAFDLWWIDKDDPHWVRAEKLIKGSVTHVD